MKIGDPWAETPQTSQRWRAMSDDRRIDEVKRVIDKVNHGGTQAVQRVVSATADGRVLLELSDGVKWTSAHRGLALRQAERMIKESLDEGITVYLQAAADKNMLRRLRGVVVKG